MRRKEYKSRVPYLKIDTPSHLKPEKMESNRRKLRSATKTYYLLCFRLEKIRATGELGHNSQSPYKSNTRLW